MKHNRIRNEDLDSMELFALELEREMSASSGWNSSDEDSPSSSWSPSTNSHSAQYSPTFDHRISSPEIHSEIPFPIIGRGVETRKPPDIGPKLTPAHCSVEPAGPSTVNKKTCVLHVDEEQRLSPVTTETRISAVSAETHPSSTVD
eukprot:512062_1